MSGATFWLTRRNVLASALLICAAFTTGYSHAQEAAKLELPPMDVKLDPSYYPKAAAKLGVQGRVLAEFNITRRGKVDNVTIQESEPAFVFDDAVRAALKDIKFTVPGDWEASGNVLHRFHLSYVFKIYPCPDEPCKAPTAHESADDSVIITIQAK